MGREDLVSKGVDASCPGLHTIVMLALADYRKFWLGAAYDAESDGVRVTTTTESERRAKRVELVFALSAIPPAPIYLLGCFSILGLVEKWNRTPVGTKVAVLALDSLFAAIIAITMLSLLRGPLPRPLRLCWGVGVLFLYGLAPLSMRSSGQAVLGSPPGTLPW